MIDRAVLYLGDCRDILPTLQADAVITDPPYGVTSLDWDKTATGWLELIQPRTLWCFGSLRFFMGQQFEGWTYAQEIVWESTMALFSTQTDSGAVHELAWCSSIEGTGKASTRSRKDSGRHSAHCSPQRLGHRFGR